MNKYIIFKDGSDGLPLEVGEVEAVNLTVAVRAYFKQTLQIIPGAWAVPAEMTIDAFMKEPPPGFDTLLDIIHSEK